MKTLGILGGVGPETTSEVYLSLTSKVREMGQTNYPPIVIYNLPFSFEIEFEAIVKGVNSEKMIPYLVNGVRVLKKSGVDFGIMPCNTLHRHINEIREAAGFPFLSILEETSSFIKKTNIKTIGILATETTVKARIYDEALCSQGIKIVLPSPSEQSVVNSIIMELLSGGNKIGMEKELEKICSSLSERGAEAVLLACTDLQLITGNVKINVPFIDTTKILLDATMREMLK